VFCACAAAGRGTAAHRSRFEVDGCSDRFGVGKCGRAASGLATPSRWASKPLQRDEVDIRPPPWRLPPSVEEWPRTVRTLASQRGSTAAKLPLACRPPIEEGDTERDLCEWDFQCREKTGMPSAPASPRYGVRSSAPPVQDPACARRGQTGERRIMHRRTYPARQRQTPTGDVEAGSVCVCGPSLA